MTPTLTEDQLAGATRRLKDEFAGIFSAESIEATVRDSHQQLAARARVAAFLPTLAERFARERLSATARAEGHSPRVIPEVLFVCVHNAGRSQMAAGLLSHRAQGQVSVRSAGSDPSDQINPAVFDAMHEIGIDLSEAYPKPLTDEVVRAADVVITMGCGDACPIYPGKRYRDWELTDPQGKDIAAVRLIRDDIDRRVRELIQELKLRG